MFILSFTVAVFQLVVGLDISIVTRDGCGFSTAIRSFLNDKKLEFSDYNITQNGHDIRNDLGMREATFPLVFVDNEYIGGYEEAIKNPKLV